MKKTKAPVENLDHYEKARNLIYAVWRAIPWDTISPMRRIGIYEEFTSKIKSSSGQVNLAKFVERLCAKMGIRNVGDTAIVKIIAENDEKVLDALRSETIYVVAMMREVIEEKQELRESGVTWDEVKEATENAE